MAQVINTAHLIISLESDTRQPLIRISGEVNNSNISDLTALLDSLAEGDQQCVSLDLGEVESIDTEALAELAHIAGIFTGKHKRLHLKNTSMAVRNLLDKHFLSDLFCRERECLGCQTPGSCVAASRMCRTDVFTFPSSIEYCHIVRERVMDVAQAAEFTKCELSDVMLAVGEAVSNAIKHGHSGESDSSFTVSCVATNESMRVSVTDNGPGFSFDDLPSFEEALFAEHGRGIHCMNAVMDEVSYSFDGGTTVRLVKRANKN